MRLGKIIAVLVALVIAGVVAVSVAIMSFGSDLPPMIKVADYKPLLVTEVFARGGEKIGEFSNQNRKLIPYDQIPQNLSRAFIAAEDSQFFEHGGVNYVAMARAFMVNVAAGKKRQGASTITQQVARSLLLSSEKTYTRKIKEVLLAHKMEENLTKEEILYLYLNQIYFGEGAYGVVAAADTYFRKTPDKLTLAEMAILAGLPQAPSNYSPTDHPKEAKGRQRYVLERMAANGFITEDERKKAVEEPVTVYLNKDYTQVAPFFVETLRQMLIQQLGSEAVMNQGLRVYTSIDFKAQAAANIDVQNGLRDVDKRQGFRGAAKNLATPKDQEQFLLATRKKLKNEKVPTRIIKPDGNVIEDGPLVNFQRRDARGLVITNIPEYITKGQIVDGLVINVNDELGLVAVRFAEGTGLIDVADMAWARKPDVNVNYDYAPKVSKPSTVLKVGDVVQVKVASEKYAPTERLSKLVAARKKPGFAPLSLPDFNNYAGLTLEQQPLVEGSLISFDQQTGDVMAMVGGFEFIKNKNEFNRTIQARRQTGSSFKTIVYASALDKGYNPATLIQDAPVVFESKGENANEGQDEDVKTWKPHNHGQKFSGDILFRTALIRSLNIPAVKVLEGVGVPWAIDYARRLGVFSPMNADLSLVLGSSSLTLYEMTKVFSHFGRLGQRIRPVAIHKVVNTAGETILQNVSLDKRFEKEIQAQDQQFEERRKAYLERQTALQQNGLVQQGGTQGVPGTEAPEVPPKPEGPQIFFADPDQLISPQTAYVMTTLLSGVVNEEGGTAGKARAIGRPVAGKTGTTNGYFDAWFVGYTQQVVTGVWVGFDEEKSLGPGEVGGRAALPIWVDYMKEVHKDLPAQDFRVPSGVVFANIDNETGKLASASSSKVVRQAFVQGSEPSLNTTAPTRDDETDFLKKDLTD